MASEDGERQVKGWDIGQRGQGLWVQESHDGIWGGPSPRGDEKAPDRDSEEQETLVLGMLLSLDKARVSMPLVVAQTVKLLSAMQETQVRSLG